MVIIDLRRNDSRGYHTSQETDYLVIATYLPPISIGTSSEPDWNLIGTSSKEKLRISAGQPTSLSDKQHRKQNNVAPPHKTSQSDQEYMKHNLLKSVILSVILLMGVSNAWGEVVLRYQKDMPSGNYDGNTSKTMTQSSANSNRYYCEISLTANSSYGFFIINGSNYYKVNVTATSNNSVQLYDYGSSNYGNSNHRVTYKTGTAGIYIFTYDASNHKICVSPKSSETIKIAYDVAQGHDGDWNLNNYVNLTQVGSTANYTIDLDLQAKKYYMFVQISNSIYWRAGSTLDVDGFASLYYYGTTNYGNSGDKINFTPSTAGKYRFTWNHQDKTIKLEPFYSVIYNGNSHTSGSVPTTSLHLKGSTVTVASNSGNLARTGYTFGGWNTNSTGTGTNYTAGSGSFTMGSSNTTLYANWKENKYSVDISTDGNGTTNQTGTKSVGIVGIDITATPNPGYAFKQWEVTDGAKVASTTSASTTITATAAGTVTAVFEEKPATTIYLEPTNFWNSDNPTYVAHVWNASGYTDIPMTAIGEAPYKYYKAEVPYGYTGVVFFRKSPDGKTLWNQTADLTIPTNKNTLYEIKSTGDGTTTKATGEWKDAYLFYTVTLGSSMFGPYGISYNGQSYYSHKDEDVTVNVPHGSSINFLEGQPYSDIYSGDIMEKGKVRKFDLTQPYTVLRDVKFESNYVTKVPQTVYLGVPNTLDTDDNPNNNWDKQASYANFLWRHDSYDGLDMTGRNDMGEFEFEENGVKYYQFTIQPGCNHFCFQRKTPKSDPDQPNNNTDQSRTLTYYYEVLTTDINCYMLTGGMYDTKHTGHWCALPPRDGDYRLLYVEQVVEKDANGYTVITRKKQHPSDVVRADELNEQGTIVSLHTYKERTYEAKLDGGETYTSSNNPEIILQRYDGSKWVDEEWHMVYGPLETLPMMACLPGRKNASPGSDIDDLKYHDGIEVIKNDSHEDQGSGVWNFYIVKNGSTVTLDLNRTHRYTGDYYIRTNAAFGEWNSYKGSDNHMTRSDVSKHHSNYSHYYCKWVSGAGTNVKFTIANDYGMAISDTLVADSTTLWGELLADADKMVTGETLPASANVRFAWNEKSNFLHRAYLAGSTDVASRFLVLEGKTNQLYNAEGNALAAGVNNGTDPRYGLNANEEIFNDISNWVYYTDVQMKPGAELKLTAKYNDKVQYFVGQAGDNYNNTVLAGTGTQKYLIRLLYDFKTNELISAYVPGGQAGKEIEAIETNLMLIRKENDVPRQLSFNTNNMKDVGKQAYGVLELTQETLEDNDKNIYVRSLYWISFPFDVRITDIFGFGEYGKHWIIQSYDGAKRAANGLWTDSETNWVYHFDPNTLNAGTSDQGIMKRGVGYVVALDLDQIKADDLFVGRINTLALYFPSTNTITEHIVNRREVIIPVPEHVCTINRNTPKGDRRVKDSHWNVIGVPSYINAVGEFGSIEGKFNHIELENRPQQLQFYYRWLGDYDKYEVTTPSAEVNFNSLTAYMVQYAGDLTWTSVLNEGPASLAAKRNSDDMKQHHLRLELQQNGTEQDRTFIQLQEDEVTTSFDFNYDLCKIKNGGANIYSLIATDRDPIEVAGNVMPIQETVIPVGVVISAAGEYTFAMPDGTDGIVVELIDYETNTTTNLLLDNYTVNLGKGTFDNRFALHVQPSKVTTSVGNVNTNSNGVKKYLIDGILYMQKDGVLYDAQGKLVR